MAPIDSIDVWLQELVGQIEMPGKSVRNVSRFQHSTTGGARLIIAIRSYPGSSAVLGSAILGACTLQHGIGLDRSYDVQVPDVQWQIFTARAQI